MNDNYLSSVQIAEPGSTRLPPEFNDAVDTTEATTQADLFDPNRDGIAFGGAGLESTRCGTTDYGRTVWYDFVPLVHGGVELLTSGYDNVIRVYEYNPRTAQITRTVECQNASPGGAERMILDQVTRGKAYTVQVGAVASIAPATPLRLGFEFAFFADRDRDGILDVAPDRCLTQRGIQGSGGCPPEIRPNPRIGFDRTQSGLKLTRFVVEQLPKGARVEARCSKCGTRQVRTARGASVKLDRFIGQVVPAGARLEIFTTRARTKSGRYRFGAIGSYIRFDATSGSLGRRTLRCLKPGSRKPLKRCT